MPVDIMSIMANKAYLKIMHCKSTAIKYPNGDFQLNGNLIAHIFLKEMQFD